MLLLCSALTVKDNLTMLCTESQLSHSALNIF